MSQKCVLKIVKYASTDYDAVINLRYKILRKPLGLIFSKNDLIGDKDEIIVAMFEQNKALACVQMQVQHNNTIKFRQMAVDNHLQRQGLGTKLLIFAEKIAHEKHFDKIILHARKTAVPFYQKLGYTVVGKEFVEVKTPHLLMTKSV